MTGRGLLVAVEGPDGVGRTTQCRRLKRWLGGDVPLVRLRGSPIIREPLRRLQRRGDVAERALFLLYAADLADQVHYVIEPALAAGRTVIADRYLLTPMVRAAARGEDPTWTARVLSFAPTADLTLLLEADARLRLERMLSRRRFLRPREAGVGSVMRQDPVEQALHYQRLLDRLYPGVQAPGPVVRVDASRSEDAIEQDLREQIAQIF